MNRIAVIDTAATTILATSQGFDLDHDAHLEFIIRVQPSSPDENSPSAVYECIADNTFVLAHVIDLENNPNDVYDPVAVGDIDQDGLSDLVLRGSDWIENSVVDHSIRVYESASPVSYPIDLAWEATNNIEVLGTSALVADTDVDGKQEIIGHHMDPPALVVYENDGDDSYVQTAYELIPDEFAGLGSLEIVSDLDGDGRVEILIGGYGGFGTDSLWAFESTGDDTFELVWTWDFEPSITVQFIVDAGDLDNDGKKEFLAGGLKPNAPLETHLHVFEAVGDNDFQPVATWSLPNGPEAYSDAAVADVDGDGSREIVLGTTSLVAIYGNTGDNSWQMIWSKSAGPVSSIGAGDHDQDGKDEIIFRSGGPFGSTGVWEIDPADAADPDGDGRVDVIDNCPQLYNPGQEDADGDAVGDACDNCVYGPNPTQGPAIFGQQITALDPDTFSWSEPAEVVYATGDLALVDSYTVDLVDTLPLGTSFVDLSVPGTSQGFFYLARPNCGVGSWQSILGAEPGRDTALP